jgi:hypothetical protein
MCPDRQLLSVYLDGELPSPWKEKLESHLARCPDCRRELERYRLAGDTAEQSRVEAAKERVWRKLEERRRSGGGGRPVSVWRRRVSVPLPAAVAAAALFIAAAFFFTRGGGEPAAIPGMLLATEEDLETPGILPVSDIKGVLQYLDGGDSADILILRLPESRSFISSGEPAIIKAADYSRRQP